MMTNKTQLQKIVCNRRTCLAIVLLIIVDSMLVAQSRVVGYYPAWLRSTLPASRIQYENLTYIVHAFAWPERNGNIARYGDLLYPELVSRTHTAGKKILIALGGWGQSDGFSPMSADTSVRKTCITNIVKFCDDNGYDGVDIDWEYPATLADKNNLNLLVRELHQAFCECGKDWLISIAIPAGDWAGQWFDYDSLRNYVAWFGCMTYDFMGSWVSIATHNSPLYSHPDNPQGSVHSAMQYLSDLRKIPKSQILVGIPLYGKGCNATGIFQANTGGNVEYYYSQIKPKIGNGWNYYWDAISQVPYLLNTSATQFITFDDTVSVRLKCLYAREQGLGGVMLWALGQDVVGDTQPLLETVGRALITNTGMGACPSLLPETYSGLQNFPNPFNSTTLIRFYLPQEEHVKLEVYDILGRTLGIVLNQRKPEGWNTTRFDATGLSTGCYFYKLTGTDFSKTAKMLVTR